MTKHFALVFVTFVLTMFGTVMSQETSSGFAPSFDCNQATLWDETIICADSDLSAFDRRIAAAYRTILEQIDGEAEAALRAEQRAWIAERNGCEGAGGYLCLFGLMEARAQQLEAWQSASGIDLSVGRWGYTASREIVGADVANLSCLDLSLMRNEIFARRGYIFGRDDYRNYFTAQPWYPPYEPVVADTSVHNQRVVEMLSSVERDNIDILLVVEETQGCR